MAMDPKFLQELIQTFTVELDEQSQAMTDALLKLEKMDLDHPNYNDTINTIFRAAHNIKGAARGIGITTVGEIAHQIESLFTAVQKKTLSLTPEIIDISLIAVDKMRIAMNAYIHKTDLPFDLPDFVAHLARGEKFTEKNEKSHDKNTQSKLNTDNSMLKSPKRTESHDYKSKKTVRVSVDKLEHISGLMEELQVNKISIEEHYKHLATLMAKTKNLTYIWKRTFPKDYKYSDTHLQKVIQTSNDMLLDINQSVDYLFKKIRGHVNELSIISNSLQDETRMIRLLPASTLLRDFTRTVRDMGQELQKDVELILHGDDVQLDKMVLDGLQAPLVHLLRNAIDHGIEDKLTRLKQGKSEKGHITIDVIDEGNQILIVVTDDGSGIDIRTIAKIAEEKKLATQSELETLTDNDILEFMFHPGFSTKQTVTSISGRGIGLDIVKSGLQDLKGNVTLSTELGIGTTFYLRVPLTLSSEHGLTLICGGELFVIPIFVIERVIIASRSNIIEVEGSEAILVDDIAVLLRKLSDLLAIEEKIPANSDNLSIIIVKSGRNRLGIIVEEIVGEREIVIKPLQPPLAKLPYIAGGTLSGTGQVIIVLNMAEILNSTLQTSRVTRIVSLNNETKKTEVPHILVVDDSITTRTLEQNILRNKGYKVTTAVNGKEGWDILQKQKFSLLITDINMPIMDGFTLTEHIKKSETLRDMPVIIITSMGSEAEKKRGLEVGADAYIIKNEFESGELLRIVSQLV